MMKAQQDRRRIAIIGLGLIGGSFGLALKAAGVENLEIVGHDLDRSAASEAHRLGAIDRAEHDLPRAVREAAVVVIATPVLAVAEVMREIAPHLAPGAIVTDTASTKAQVMEWAERLLPQGVQFVGGHPMAGKEAQGIKNAEAGLFQGRAYCLCPAVRADEAAITAVIGLVRLIGARPLFLDPQEHDQYAAAISHMPLILSTALFTLVRSSPSWQDIAPLASSAFRDLTRLASGDPRMSHDICVTNREAAIHWIDRMQEELRRYRDLLQDARDDALYETFVRAQADREEFLARGAPRREDRPVPDVRGEMLTSLLLGGWAMERLRKARELAALMKEAPQRQRPAEGEPEGARRRPSLAERIAEDIRRDLERLEQKRSGEKDR